MKGLFGFGKKKEDNSQQSSQSGKYIVRYERKACIGAGTCAAVADKYWVMKDDGKADLKGSKETEDKVFERFIEESELAENKMAAEGCPSLCIHVINKDTGEKII